MCFTVYVGRAAEKFNAHAVYAGDNATATSAMSASSLASEGVKKALSELLSKYKLLSTGLLDVPPQKEASFSEDSASRMSLENSQSPPQKSMPPVRSQGSSVYGRVPPAISLPPHFPSYPPSGPWNINHSAR
jgi:hypothetical protein